MQRLMVISAFLGCLAFISCTERAPYGSDPGKAKTGVAQDTMRRDNTLQNADTSANGAHNGGL